MNMEESSSSSVALLCSVFLNLNVPPPLGHQVVALCRLYCALVRRRRARELAERQRRRRRYLRRRRAFLLSSMAAVLSLTASTGRNVWVRNPSPGNNFWSATDHFDHDEWKAQFRVSRPTFDYLLDLIGADIERRRTRYREPIEPRRRLAITLWWFARSGEYRSIASMFGVGITTVCMIVRQVTSAIVDRLYPRFVSLPSGHRLDDTVNGFKDRGYPQCAGAIGGTHVPIATPRDNPEDYHNTRGWHSVILQAVVDHSSCFIDVYTGWPGRSHSATVLASSDLFLKAEDRLDGYLFPREKSMIIEGVEIPVHIIGDASYPLKPWLMKAYTKEDLLSPQQCRFTFSLTSALEVVNTAFARLKGRWRCLLKKNDIDISMMPRVVAACCVLHNICEARGDGFLPEWNTEMASSPNSFRQPDTEPYTGVTDATAELIRHHIAHTLFNMLPY